MDYEKINILNDSSSGINDCIKKIIKNNSQNDPFLIFNMGDVLEKLENWKKVFPTVQNYFAVQCNNFPLVLETLAALDSSFFCASQEEIKTILNLNVDPNKIIFGNPVKPISHIKYAANAAVSLLVFDNEQELYKIKDHHPSAKLILRININSQNENIFCKFGCDLETECLKLLKLAKALNLNIVGISFHLGSYKNINPQLYLNAIKSAKDAFDSATSLGFNMEILDIGGGFSNNISEIGKHINKALNQHFPATTKFIAEPGTYFVKSCFQLLANIHSKRTATQSGNEILQMYYMNTGVYQMLMPIYYHSQKYSLKPLSANKEMFKSIVWGPTCDALDKIAECVLPEMFIGDWVVIENVGAYSLAQATNWNGILIPKVYYVVQKKDYFKLKDLIENNGLISKLKFIDNE